MAATGIAATMAGPSGVMFPKEAGARKKIDIGEIKSLKIDVLTDVCFQPFVNTHLNRSGLQA